MCATSIISTSAAELVLIALFLERRYRTNGILPRPSGPRCGNFRRSLWGFVTVTRMRTRGGIKVVSVHYANEPGDSRSGVAGEFLRFEVSTEPIKFDGFNK